MVFNKPKSERDFSEQARGVKRICDIFPHEILSRWGGGWQERGWVTIPARGVCSRIIDKFATAKELHKKRTLGVNEQNGKWHWCTARERTKNGS
jgi:hypothetical protein